MLRQVDSLRPPAATLPAAAARAAGATGQQQQKKQQQKKNDEGQGQPGGVEGGLGWLTDEALVEQLAGDVRRTRAAARAVLDMLP